MKKTIYGLGGVTQEIDVDEVSTPPVPVPDPPKEGDK